MIFSLLSAQTAALTWYFVFLLLVDGTGEGVSEGNGSEEHLDADDKVLPACRHGAGTYLLSVDEERVGDDATSFQDGEDHSYQSSSIFNQSICTFMHGHRYIKK